MTSTWESVTKVMRTTTGLVGTATKVGMMRTRERERDRERERRRRASSRLEEVRGQEVESGDFRVKSKGFIYVHAGTPGTGSGLLVLLMTKRWWNDDAVWRHVLQCSSAFHESRDRVTNYTVLHKVSQGHVTSSTYLGVRMKIKIREK